jgi:hypothetical protein
MKLFCPIEKEGGKYAIWAIVEILKKWNVIVNKFIFPTPYFAFLIERLQINIHYLENSTSKMLL